MEVFYYNAGDEGISATAAGIFLLNLATLIQYRKIFRHLHACQAAGMLSQLIFHYAQNCGRWRNRTPTKGFGDLRSTTKLIAQ